MRRLLIAGLLWLALVLGLAAAAAGAARPASGVTPASAVTNQDTASTKAFIASSERYDLLEAKRIPAITAREDSYVSQVSSGCSKALAGAPARGSTDQQLAILEFENEVGAALEIDVLQPIRAITNQVGVSQERLRFSDPVLAWAVHSTAAATSAFLALRPPDVCADARALAASQYTKLTPAGSTFWRDVSEVLSSASLPPTKLLPQMRAYAPAAVTRALKRLPVLQRRFDTPLALTRHSNAIMDAVFAGPPPGQATTDGHGGP